MSPEEPLNNYSILQVEKMIMRALDILETTLRNENNERHTENTKKLDKLILLIIGTLLTVIGGIFTSVVMHVVR